ncbi:hypothetical protein GCM10027446_22010 [Angustibacter peucedani]
MNRAEPDRPLPTSVVLAVAGVVAALSASTLVGELSGGTAGATVALDAVAGLASVLLAPVLLRRPVVGALALAVLAALSPAATPGSTIGTLHVARRRPFRTAAVVAGAGALAHAVQGIWRPMNQISTPWWLVLVVVAHAALLGWGAWSRARDALVCSLRERAAQAEAEAGRKVAEARAAERTRIAREMHDVLAHRLSLLATYAGALEYRPDASPERLAAAAGVVRTGVSTALDELREVITVLRDDPDDSDDSDGVERAEDAEPSVPRPQPRLVDLPRLVDETRSAGTAVDLLDRVAPGDEPPSVVGRAAYRVVQEALTNARRHAPGEAVRVQVDGRPGEQLVVEVTNPLPPDGASPPSPGSGSGLVGMSERARLVGGTVDHGRTPDGTFRVLARLPWPRG